MPSLCYLQTILSLFQFEINHPFSGEVTLSTLRCPNCIKLWLRSPMKQTQKTHRRKSLLKAPATQCCTSRIGTATHPKGATYGYDLRLIFTKKEIRHLYSDLEIKHSDRPQIKMPKVDTVFPIFLLLNLFLWPVATLCPKNLPQSPV